LRLQRLDARGLGVLIGPVAVPDADYAPLAVRLAALAEADPGREVCGFVLEDAAGRLEVVQVRNLAGEGDGPPGLPGDLRGAFLADPAAHLSISRRVRAEGGRIAAVFHSHVDAPAALSELDLEQSVSGGTPIHPGVDQLVIGTRLGKVKEIRVFRWQEGAFHGSPIERGG
jgi:proteasome lid subunit RPN8/RPN11